MGRELWDLNSLRIPLAVITNGSLLWDEAVRTDLCGADWVSIKVDTVDPDMWVRLNRPHRTLHLHTVLDGIVEFARRFTGELAVETMLVDGVNDDPGVVNETAEFIATLHPPTSYMFIPTHRTWVNRGTFSAASHRIGFHEDDS